MFLASNSGDQQAMQCSSCGFQSPPEISTCPGCGQKAPFVPVSSPPATYSPATPYHSMQSQYPMPSQFHRPAQPRQPSSLQLRPSPFSTPAPLPLEHSLQSVPPHTSLTLTTQGTAEDQQRPFISSEALGRPGVVTKPRTDSSPSQRNHKALLIISSSLVGILLLLLGGYAIVQLRGQNILTLTSIQTVHPIATLPPITTMDPHDLYTQATSRTPIFSDLLQTQGANRWPAINTTGTCYIQAKALHTYRSDGSLAALCLAKTTKLTDFAFQGQVTISRGDTAGLIFRADSPGHKQYLFAITTSGIYMLALTNEPNDPQTHVIAGGISSTINQGLNHSNQLTVIARNSTFYLYINKQFVTQVNDGTHSSGAIGLFSSNSYGNATEAAFNNVRVWSV